MKDMPDTPVEIPVFTRVLAQAVPRGRTLIEVADQVLPYIARPVWE